MSFIKDHSKAIKLLAKIVLSVSALYYVFSKIDVGQTFNAMRSINVWLLFLSIFIYALSQVVSAFRLNVFYKYVPVKISSVVNLKLYWLGMFYNLFLPGGVGGDGYKVFLIRKYYNASLKRLVGTVLADRLSGLAIILVYLCALVYFIDYDLGKNAVPEDGIKWVHDMLVWINPYLNYFIILIPFIALGYYLYLWTFSRHLTASAWRVLLLSIIIQGLQMVSAIMILKSMGTELAGRQNDYLFLFLLSSIMSAIPISLGGLGLREVTFMFGSQYLGLNQDHAIALSILFYFISLLVSAFGAYYAYRTSSIFQKKSVV
ncbi:hypothetical protein SAMN06265379_1052 [Saccharicrinis carchari]|uniref:Lysylphosphatidylglycerol synthase TM region n=1 Tax=Saccharicrinis carchari TaxID=1168039 RepID=A0A521DAG8_SACCC|nr:lysylphosphatidylglycerol synthase transmembrane domain-containing protein [Saccharicrinis carchari]SMO68714.1 hypothetical protein SAMN06265379_1052 [Saccharicrinis carchari]